MLFKFDNNKSILNAALELRKKIRFLSKFFASKTFKNSCLGEMCALLFQLEDMKSTFQISLDVDAADASTWSSFKIIKTLSKEEYEA